MDEEAPVPRPLSAWLLIGMLTLPILFCWLLLRREYSRSQRIAGFTYAGATIAIGITGAFA